LALADAMVVAVDVLDDDLAEIVEQRGAERVLVWDDDAADFVPYRCCACPCGCAYPPTSEDDRTCDACAEEHYCCRCREYLGDAPETDYDGEHSRYCADCASAEEAEEAEEAAWALEHEAYLRACDLEGAS